MDDKPPPARFLVRQGVKDYMVWDRGRRGPATIGGQPQVGLARKQAETTRDSLETYYAKNVGKVIE